MLVAEVVRGKALALLVETANVTDASGNAVDLRPLRPTSTRRRRAPTPTETADEPTRPRSPPRPDGDHADEGRGSTRGRAVAASRGPALRRAANTRPTGTSAVGRTR